MKIDQTKIVEEIKEKRELDSFILPDYDEYCIANIPNLIHYLFGSKDTFDRSLPLLHFEQYKERFNNIVIIMIDSLGYNQLNVFNDHSPKNIFNDLKEAGTFLPLTSVFPATTTTALTTLHTGALPQEHGLLGCRMYLSELGLMGNMINMSPVDDYTYDLLFKMGLKREEFPGVETIHQQLTREGVASYTFVNLNYRGKGLSKILHTGTEALPYLYATDLFMNLTELLETVKTKKNFVFTYWGAPDGISHVYGATSDRFLTDLDYLSEIINNEFVAKLSPATRKETLLMVTADHGQVDIPHLIMTTEHPELLKNLVVPPIGEYRASYLYIKPGKVDEVDAYFKEHFRDKIVTWNSLEMMRKGLFGSEGGTEKIESRIGDLIALSREGYCLRYPFPQSNRPWIDVAHHGGLTENEIFVPFIVSDMNEI
ncbi:alkaline phosphatase family protein [bacterium]|nr:alkaline phosphatase family protein [bacterium]